MTFCNFLRMNFDRIDYTFNVVPVSQAPLRDCLLIEDTCAYLFGE